MPQNNIIIKQAKVNMNKYIEQLIEQFDESKKRIVSQEEAMYIIKGTNPDEIDFEEVENYIYGERTPLSEILGIDKSSLPDDSLLDDKQVETLALECEELWNCYNFYADFPENVPPRLRYRKFRESWDEPSMYMSSGHSHFEFCNYDKEECPFPEYCNKCSELEEEYKLYENPVQPGDTISDFIEKQGVTDGPGRVKVLKEKIKDFDHAKCIPGIHNYCDRWCERCQFTGNCTVFLFEKDISESNQQSNGNDFLDYLSLMFEATGEILSEQMNKFNVEFHEIVPPHPDFMHIDHPLVKFSAGYSEKVNNWYRSGCFDVINKENQNEINCEATEVILWYHLFITAKLERACLDFKDFEEFEEYDGAQYDSNGSAKIAMIAIKRSIAAWGLLLEKHLNHEDEIYSFLKILGELLGKTKTAFPDAECFIRPGLDE